ncbi:MAG: InlB B-repeat-containing protein, partial [Intestinibacter sp.]
MAELVPTVNYVSEIPMKIRDSLAGREISVEEYIEICQNIYKETYVDALGFQESIKGDSGYNVLLDYDKAYFLIGTNEKTIARIMFTTLKDNHMNFVTYEEDLHYDTSGDGTVPYMSASIMKKVESLPLERKFIIKDTDHQETVQNDIPIRWIKGKLGITGKSQTTYGTRESAEELVSDEAQGHDHMVFRIACPVDVNVESNGEALNSSIKGFDAKTSFGRLDLIGQNSDIKMLCVDTSDDYDVTLDGTGEGTMDYTVRYFNSEDKLQDETTIKDVPITENTIIKTHPVATEDMVLEVDSDGDGTVDKTYTAPKGETVDVQNTVKFNPNNGDQVITRAVDSDGKLNYTPEAPTSEGYTFVGWFRDTDDITTKYKSGATYTEDVTYTAKWAHVDMLGAQVKAVVDDKSGIRFGTKIYNDGDEIVEKGTIILPARLLPEGEELTLDTPKIARSVGKVNYEVNEAQNYVTYLGTLVGIPRAQFDAEITASAYVIYKDKAGNKYTVYSPYKNGSTTINKLLNS